jgi:hypothetical protein
LVDTHRALIGAPTHANQVTSPVADAPGVASSSFGITHSIPPLSLFSFSLSFSFSLLFMLFYFSQPHSLSFFAEGVGLGKMMHTPPEVVSYGVTSMTGPSEEMSGRPEGVVERLANKSATRPGLASMQLRSAES